MDLCFTSSPKKRRKGMLVQLTFFVSSVSRPNAYLVFKAYTCISNTPWRLTIDHRMVWVLGFYFLLAGCRDSRTEYGFREGQKQWSCKIGMGEGSCYKGIYGHLTHTYRCTSWSVTNYCVLLNADE